MGKSHKIYTDLSLDYRQLLLFSFYWFFSKTGYYFYSIKIFNKVKKTIICFNNDNNNYQPGILNIPNKSDGFAI